jgi:hypothetical protein
LLPPFSPPSRIRVYTAPPFPGSVIGTDARLRTLGRAPPSPGLCSAWTIGIFDSAPRRRTAHSDRVPVILHLHVVKKRLLCSSDSHTRDASSYPDLQPVAPPVSAPTFLPCVCRSKPLDGPLTPPESVRPAVAGHTVKPATPGLRLNQLSAAAGGEQLVHSHCGSLTSYPYAAQYAAYCCHASVPC